MKRNWIIPLAALLAAGTIALTGCGNTAAPEETAASSAAESTAPSSAATESTVESTPASSAAAEAVSGTAPVINNVGDQLLAPEQGDLIAIMETSQGTIKMRLFPEQAPKTVQNFVALANRGDYENIPFHRVIDGFMIQGGMTGGDTLYGGSFEDEFSDKLINLRGAVSMANTSKPNTNGTQFFINQAKADRFAGWEYFQSGYEAYQEYPDGFTFNYGAWVDMSKVTDAVKQLYTENGGSPTLDGAYSTTGTGHTVFGQVFEGMDVVDKIAAAKTDAHNMPTNVEDYLIKSITITAYEG